jgi:hypothetical protein
MSGGSYDYVYGRIKDFAEQIRTTDPASRSLRLAFKQHLLLVAKAAHAIEWVDSCDYKTGDEIEYIRAVLAPEAELNAAREEAEKTLRLLQETLERSR